MPLVTVLMPVYNGEKYIKEAIDSVLAQTYKDFELLIVNDGSTDRSADIIRSYVDPRIRLVELEKNSGLAMVRNRLFAESKTEYLILLDSDDIACPERIDKQVNFLKKNPDFGMVGSWVEHIDENGHPTGVYWKDRYKPEEIPVVMLFHNYFAQSSIALRKSALPSEHYRLEFPPSEDYDLWIRIAEKSKVWNLPEVLVRYRIHASNIVKSKAEAQSSAINLILTNQLGKLGIVPTAEELELHRANFTYAREDLAAFLDKREKWIIKITEANKKTGLFKEPAFSSAIGGIWYDTCYSNSKGGMMVWRKFWMSGLSKNFDKRQMRLIAKLLVKCLFR